MKKLIAALAAAALIVSLIGCAAPASAPANAVDIPAASTPGVESPIAGTPGVESPDAGSQPAQASAEGEYTVNSSITVDNGRRLDLTLHGRKLADTDFYGISSIDVFDGETLLQTINASEATVIEWGTEYATDTTESLSEDGGIRVDDMNFDGAGDIALVGWVGATANEPCYYWLWDSAAERFAYAFCLTNAVVDDAAKQIVSSGKNGAACIVTDYYAYADDGSLTFVRREMEVDGEDTALSAELAALLTDISDNYHDGTAGCSLVAAKYAAMLLDFCAEHEMEFDNISAAVCRFFFALDKDAQQEFSVKFGSIHSAAAELLSGDAGDILDSAGYDALYSPWNADAADTFFLAVYSGMGPYTPAA